MKNDISLIPDWVFDSVFYQIFPERFENGDPSNDPSGTESWGSPPKSNNFFGGDLQGILNRIDYLKELGINALYLNPIFEATSNHKYNATDYEKIDPSFGTNELFAEFILKCRTNGIRVVLDGVFNHVGVNHFAFKDVVEKGRESKYASWFNIYSFPVKPPKNPNYECWWGYGALPKLMVQNPEVKKYLFDVVRTWTGKIDGWRLDVPNELPHEFWKEFRKEVRSISPECYIVGEIWHDAGSWLQGDEFDAVMNYLFRSACLDYFAADKLSAKKFSLQIENMRKLYSASHNLAMLNLLGSHDTERWMTICKNELWRVKLAFLFQMTHAGVPMIYYGDEIGMQGGKDPDCRRCMIWDQGKWNKELLSQMKDLAQFRLSSKAVRRGDFTMLLADTKKDIIAFRRQYKESAVVVVMNRSTQKKTVEVPTGIKTAEWKEHGVSNKIKNNHGTISTTMQAHSGKIFFTI